MIEPFVQREQYSGVGPFFDSSAEFEWILTIEPLGRWCLEMGRGRPRGERFSFAGEHPILTQATLVVPESPSGDSGSGSCL